MGRGIPWYVMTSEATDLETRQLFETEHHFGLGRENIFIFSQGMLPAWDLEGRMLLENPGRISQSPDGHGGLFTAMRGSGALEDMGSRGIDRIFYYQVDNPLVRIGDPVYLGFHEETGAEMSCKVVRKRDPMEKVGVVASRNGKPAMIEYTEFADGQRFQRDEAGQLVYWAGNIAVHIFNLDFVDRIAQGSEGFLPLHASAKKITSLDRGGTPQLPSERNGYKLERFVFDALPQAKRICILEASAQEEFAPVKNAEGADSPATVRDRLTAQYGAWLEGTGIEMPLEVMAIEIDHAVIDSADEAEACGFARLAEAGDVIRVTTGMDS
jgi:UDP-N-acetylglucosamine/UDP-N-acetylgalactosamine diphosphorylase